jgi:hypothetical protein
MTRYFHLRFFQFLALALVLTISPAMAQVTGPGGDNTYPMPTGPYGYFNTCQQAYDIDTHNCSDYTMDFCDEAAQHGINCYPMWLNPNDPNVPSHMMVVVQQSETPTSLTYCMVEPQTGEIVGACWTVPKPTTGPIPTPIIPPAMIPPLATDYGYDPTKYPPACTVYDSVGHCLSTY